MLPMSSRMLPVLFASAVELGEWWALGQCMHWDHVATSALCYGLNPL